MTEAALAPRRRQRLAADLPAAALYGLAQLAGKGRMFVLLTPLGDGRVTAEAGAGAVLGVVEIEAQLARPLALPAAALLGLQRRHPDATVLAVDAPDDGPALLRIVALGADGSATVNAPEADPAGGSAAAVLADVPVLPPEQTVLLDPALLRRALVAMGRICPGPVELALAHSDLLGALVRARPSDGSGIVGATVALARMLPADG